MNDSHATVVTKYFAKIVFTVIYNIIVIKYSHHIEPMTPVSHSGVEKNNDDGKRHYFSSNRYDAAAEIVPLEKLEVNLTQNGLPQFQIYTASHFYHGVGLHPLYTQSSSMA